jgi:hypothetical protein
MNLGYIDPGSGSMILQMLLGGLAAAAVFLRLFWHRVLVALRIRKPTPPEQRAAEAGSEREPVETGRFDPAGEPVGKR